MIITILALPTNALVADVTSAHPLSCDSAYDSTYYSSCNYSSNHASSACAVLNYYRASRWWRWERSSVVSYYLYNLDVSSIVMDIVSAVFVVAVISVSVVHMVAILMTSVIYHHLLVRSHVIVVKRLLVRLSETSCCTEHHHSDDHHACKILHHSSNVLKCLTYLSAAKVQPFRYLPKDLSLS